MRIKFSYAGKKAVLDGSSLEITSDNGLPSDYRSNAAGALQRVFCHNSNSSEMGFEGDVLVEHGGYKFIPHNGDWIWLKAGRDEAPREKVEAMLEAAKAGVSKTFEKYGAVAVEA